MTELPKKIFETVNHPKRVGVIGTADSNGQPNVAYFGSPKLMEDGTLIVGCGDNLTLKNLEENPKAVFFCVEGSPVTQETGGCRLYMEIKSIQREGDLLKAIKDNIAKFFSPDAAKMVVAALIFQVNDVRPLIAEGY